MQRNFPTLPPRTADLSRRCNINDPHPVTAVCCLEWWHVLRPSEGENGRRRGLQTRLALMRFSFELRGGRRWGSSLKLNKIRRKMLSKPSQTKQDARTRTLVCQSISPKCRDSRLSRRHLNNGNLGGASRGEKREECTLRIEGTPLLH